MPPKKNLDDASSLKEKAKARRNGHGNATNGKEVADNASVHSGQASSDSNASNIKWSSQDTSVLQSYRRAYRLDTPSSFKNPLSHVVLNHGIGRLSPTMAREKSKRRVQKEQLALAVRKNFNALGVTESDVIVDWLYKSKNQEKEFRVRFAPPRK
ncbi:hypothetical protein DE146DRAFT_669587 [Phaeosphaeria sp. MPI-PUGE-AT-0046c]|nr:hypothetical protein DE146DRAFT_669587 [Phaeosphaeria sp. MPI-PUGE-AT-0046c]